MQHGMFDVLNNINADSICLQETELVKGEQKYEFPGYHCYFSCSQVRKGYSGTAIFSKKAPGHIIYGIGISEFDDECRAITAEYNDYYLVNVYVPTPGQGLRRLAYRQRWDNALKEYLSALMSIKPVIVCGDFNVAVTDLDISSIIYSHLSPGLTDEERDGFNALKALGLTDAWRHLHNDDRQYSWSPYTDKSRTNGMRLDYFLCSKEIMKDVYGCEILTNRNISDHCPVILKVNGDL